MSFQRKRLRGARVLVVGMPIALSGLAPGTAFADDAPITIKSSTVTPSTIIGGSGGTQTITLSRPAPEGGIWVWVRYDNIYRATVGNYVTVPAGQASVTFPFRASAPMATRTGAISSQVQGSPSSIARFTHQAADPAIRAVSALRFNRTTVITGTTLTGTVVLKQPAPAGGITVSLWSNNAYGPASVGVPPYLTVPAGRTSATFQAQAATDGPPSITKPSADLGTSLAGREVVIVPKVFALSNGTPPRNGTSRLVVGIGEAPNPSGTVVTLKSDNPEVKVPAQVTVPAGKPGLAFTYSMGNHPSGTPWPKVTATWNGQSVAAVIYPQ